MKNDRAHGLALLNTSNKLCVWRGGDQNATTRTHTLANDCNSRMAEEIPSLFSKSNLTVPVLVLHGEKSLRRRRDSPAQVIDTTRRKSGGGGGGGGDDDGEVSDNRTSGDRGEDYILFRESLVKNASSEERERLKAAGREDRLDYWEMSMPAHVQVEKVSQRGTPTGDTGVTRAECLRLVVQVGRDLWRAPYHICSLSKKNTSVLLR